MEVVAGIALHTQGPYALRIRSAEPDRLRIAVWGSGSEVLPGFGARGPPGLAPPAPAPAGPDTAEDGRGLRLVRACADRWGAHVLGDVRGGKLLWAECGSG
ncbi:hypothetical protein [Streptomyces sp. NPDC001815]|uniref:hypothetical protein n=1 Tax=Streptomyces sp. NPDC001815 TaxID=3154526 RepID=UPI00331846BA